MTNRIDEPCPFCGASADRKREVLGLPPCWCGLGDECPELLLNGPRAEGLCAECSASVVADHERGMADEMGMTVAEFRAYLIEQTKVGAKYAEDPPTPR